MLFTIFYLIAFCCSWFSCRLGKESFPLKCWGFPYALERKKARLTFHNLVVTQYIWIDCWSLQILFLVRIYSGDIVKGEMLTGQPCFNTPRWQKEESSFQRHYSDCLQSVEDIMTPNIVCFPLLSSLCKNSHIEKWLLCSLMKGSGNLRVWSLFPLVHSRFSISHWLIGLKFLKLLRSGLKMTYAMVIVCWHESFCGCYGFTQRSGWSHSCLF